ncbi:MAG: hypothetical protein WKF81_09080 [Thermomicrobiales bacterium]
MMLELLEIESQVRGRQSRVAADVQAYHRLVGPGWLRKSLGTLLVRFGESIRGSAQRSPVRPTPQVVPFR